MGCRNRARLPLQRESHILFLPPSLPFYSQHSILNTSPPPFPLISLFFAYPIPLPPIHSHPATIPVYPIPLICHYPTISIPFATCTTPYHYPTHLPHPVHTFSSPTLPFTLHNHNPMPPQHIHAQTSTPYPSHLHFFHTQTLPYDLLIHKPSLLPTLNSIIYLPLYSYPPPCH